MANLAPQSNTYLTAQRLHETRRTPAPAVHIFSGHLLVSRINAVIGNWLNN